MTLKRQQRYEITEFLLWNIRDHPSDIVRVTQENFKISRPAVLRYIHKLIQENRIEVEGTTRNRKYSLVTASTMRRAYEINSSLAEDKVWRNDVVPLLKGIKENVVGICHYGFTEIFNNAIDHSQGTQIEIDVKIWIDKIDMRISDNGIGIFINIQQKCKLDDPLHAILELSKGKLTTEPETHSGEGIFFSSRMFDFFAILSDKLVFGYKDNLDLLLETEDDRHGTSVHMEISTASTRTTESVFSKFTKDFGFDKTIVPVRLARYGNENLISRSQAKRLIARLDRFKTVIFDFKEVNQIGRAFADEIFRVFANANPVIQIIPTNESKKVKALIQEIKREKEKVSKIQG